MKADRFRNYNPLGSSFQMDDSKFINEFVSTLPYSGSNSMFDQILEIEYPDYVVDFFSFKNKLSNNTHEIG